MEPTQTPATTAADLTSSVEAGRVRSVESVKRALATVHSLIEVNEELAHTPGHEADAQQRVVDGEAELAALEAELAALERGDFDEAMRLHELLPKPDEV
jgi:hypothetical protein